MGAAKSLDLDDNVKAEQCEICYRWFGNPTHMLHFNDEVFPFHAACYSCFNGLSETVTYVYED